jgi:hypothetical protein
VACFETAGWSCGLSLSDIHVALPLQFKIQNIVASCDVKFPIKLEGLVRSHPNQKQNPTLFACVFAYGGGQALVLVGGTASRSGRYRCPIRRLSTATSPHTSRSSFQA